MKQKPPSRPLDIPEDVWSEAVRREGMVRSLAVSGTSSRTAVKAAAVALGLSVAQVYRLIATFRANPITGSLVVTKPGPRKGTRLLPCDVEQRIEQAINDIFMSRERPTMAKLRRDLRKDCTAAGLKPPSRTAIQARVSARSLREMVKAREGSAAARQRFVPVRPGLRPRAPLEVVQIDHTKVDIQLVDEQARAVLGRPWLTLLLDVFSRSVLGFYLSLDAPSAAGVAMAIAQGILPKTEWLMRNDLGVAWPMHGLPRSLHLDNGAEFHSRALKRGCQQHGVRIDYRPPATPRFGGHIERLMGTLMTRVHALPGTTSSSVTARGDYPSEQKAILTLREFEHILALEILGPYHNEVHSALATTPAAAWSDGIAACGAPALPPDAAAFVLDFLPFEQRVVRREGVRLFNVTYFDGTLAPLLDGTERSYRVKYDPRDMSAVFVELIAGGHLRIPCADLGRPAVTLWEQRLAIRTLREAGHRSVDETAIFAAIAEQRRVLAEAQASSKLARRTSARLPACGLKGVDASPTASLGTAKPADADDRAGDDEARVPAVAESDAWRTEFLPP
jgi:putative transposase